MEIYSMCIVSWEKARCRIISDPLSVIWGCVYIEYIGYTCIFLPFSVCAFMQEWNNPHQTLNIGDCWETGARKLFIYYALCCLKFVRWPYYIWKKKKNEWIGRGTKWNYVILGDIKESFLDTSGCLQICCKKGNKVCWNDSPNGVSNGIPGTCG